VKSHCSTCSTLPVSYLIHQRKLLVWKKIHSSDNVVLWTPSRFNYNAFIGGNTYNMCSLNLSTSTSISRTRSTPSARVLPWRHCTTFDAGSRHHWPAPLKLRPYGAIQICLLLLLLLTAPLSPSYRNWSALCRVRRSSSIQRPCDLLTLWVGCFRNTYGRRAISDAGPMAWNSLPEFIRDEQHRLFWAST